MSRHVLQIADDGRITGLYTEAIPLAELGPLSIRRASTIEYYDHDHTWRVRLIEQTTQREVLEPLFESPSRQACLDFEHEYFNQLLERT